MRSENGSEQRRIHKQNLSAASALLDSYRPLVSSVKERYVPEGVPAEFRNANLSAIIAIAQMHSTTAH
jgi:hypothetical protein